MKRWFVFGLMFWQSCAAQAQWPMPAKQVRVETNGFNVLPVTASNAQLAVDAIDDALTNRLTQAQISASYLPGTNFIGAALSNGQWTINSQTAGLLAGTNIVGATYSGGQWTISSQTAGLLAGTNIVGGTYTNGQWYVTSGADSNDFFLARGDDTQVFSGGAGSVVLTTFGTELYDYGGAFMTNTFRPRREGLYFLQATLRINSGGGLVLSERAQMKLHKNGVLYRWLDRKNDSLYEVTLLTGCVIEYATTNDVYQIWQDVDGSSTMTNAAGERYFSAALLSGGAQ